MTTYVTAIIPHRYWLHEPSGRKASVYGACPWHSDADRAEWRRVESGWTWETSDGCVGLCRVPAATYAEAVDVANRWNDWRRNAYLSHAAMYPEQAETCHAKADAIPQFTKCEAATLDARQASVAA